MKKLFISRINKVIKLFILVALFVSSFAIIISNSIASVKAGSALVVLDENVTSFQKSFTYTISNADQLNRLATLVNEGNSGSGATFILQNDISYSGENNWTPIGTKDGLNDYPFSGIFDGNNKSISGISFNNESEFNVGLFGFVKNGTIENVTVRDSSFTAASYVGGIVGNMSSGTIENCVNEAAIECTNYGGGIVGLAVTFPNIGTGHGVFIRKCTNKGSVTVNSDSSNVYAGGITGKFAKAENTYGEAAIEECFNEGTISLTCISAVSLSRTNRYVAGIVGSVINEVSYPDPSKTMKMYVRNCYNTGNIISEIQYDMIAGIVAYAYVNISAINSITIANCYNLGELESPYFNDGGIYSDSKNKNGIVHLFSEEVIFDNCFATTNKIDDIEGIKKVSDDEGSDYGADAFETGEITYLLQGAQEVYVWGQSLKSLEDGGDIRPTLTSDSASHVYYVNANCQSSEMAYTNSELVKHNWVTTGSDTEKTITCDDCGEWIKYEAPSDLVYDGGAKETTITTSSEDILAYFDREEYETAEHVGLESAPTEVGTYNAYIILTDGYSESVTFTIVPIAVTSLDIPLEYETQIYQIGDSLNAFTISIAYNNGENGTITSTSSSLELTGFDTSSVASNQTATFTYEGKTVSFTYSVILGYEYKVIHHQQDLDDASSYAGVETDTLYGMETTEAVAKEYAGFTAKAFEQTSINEDGTTIINIYYDRKVIQLTYKEDIGDTGTVVTGKYGATVTPPTTSKVGYTYIWENAPTTFPSENATYFIEWTPIKYVVSFDPGTGTGEMDDITLTYDQTSSLPQSTMTKEWHYFIGWATTKGGSRSYNDKESVKNIATEDIILYAVFETNEYELYLYANNGTDPEETSEQSCVYGEETSISTFDDLGFTVQEGYEFLGWSSTRDGEVKYTDGSAYTMTTEYDYLYAVWREIQFTITFNSLGGSDVDPIIEPNGTEITAPANPTKTGYVFAGWYTSTNNGEMLDEEFVFDVMLPVDITLYAKWNAKEYTITIDQNGGNVSGNTNDITSSATYNSTYSLEMSSEKTGYLLSGISTTENGDSVFEYDYENDTWQLKANIEGYSNADGRWIYDNAATFYIVWEPITYFVEFEANGGEEITPVAKQTFTYDVLNQKLNANTYSRNGYSFAGWATEAEGTKTYDDEDLIDSNLSSTYGATITLYAKWDANIYDVYGNFNANATDSNLFILAGIKYGFSYSTNVAQVRNNYHLVGLALERNGESVFEFNSVSERWELKDNIENYSDADGKWIHADDATFYLLWEANSGTIVFDKNSEEATGEMDTQTFTYGNSITLSDNGFANSGKIFDGWNTSSDGSGIRIENKEEINGFNLFEGIKDGDTVTLYAIWSDIPTFAVTYNLDGGSYKSSDPGVNYYQEGQLVTLMSETEFSRKGYTFSNWEYNSETYQAGDEFTISATNVEFKAVWTENTYNITFYYNGYDEGNKEEIGIKYTETFNLKNSFTREGYHFIRWSSQVDGLGTYYSDAQAVTGLSDIDGSTVLLFARWAANDYVIKFDGNGATSGEMENQSFTFNASKALSTNVFEKTNYKFTGWSTSISGTVEYTDGQSINLLTDPNEEITLYAVWAIKTYQIEFNSNEATSGTMANQDFNFGEEKALTANTYEKTGYAFQGWATEAEGAKTYDNEEVITTNLTTDGGTYTLYAVWEPNTYTIIFDGNGATSGIMENQSFTYNVSNTLRTNGFEKTNYKFTGWSTSISGTVEYTDGQSINLLTNPNEEITLYAVWAIKTYQIVFYSNEATSGTMANQSFNFGEEKGLTANTYEKTGYVFQGWANEANGEKVYDNEEVITTNLTTDLGFYNLYAVWTPNTYSVSYNGNGATSGEMGNQDCVYGTSFTLSANTYLKAGFTFRGWSTENDDEILYNDSQSGIINLSPVDNAVVVLYAVWEAKIYTISFNVGEYGFPQNDVTIKYGEAYTAPTILVSNDDTKIFDGWTYENEEFTGLTSWNIDSDVELMAQWRDALVYSVTVTNGKISGSTGTTASFNEDHIVTITADEIEGQRFTGWKEGNTIVSTNRSYEFTLTRNVSLSATYVKVYTITVSGGTITGGEETREIFDLNAEVSITAGKAPKGKEFKGWSDGEKIVSKDETYVFSAAENITLIAQYEKVEDNNLGLIITIVIVCSAVAVIGIVGIIGCFRSHTKLTKRD